MRRQHITCMLGLHQANRLAIMVCLGESASPGFQELEFLVIVGRAVSFGVISKLLRGLISFELHTRDPLLMMLISHHHVLVADV